MTRLYRDRTEAGRILSSAIPDELRERLAKGDALVLAIPRGGIVVAREVATSLGAELDVVVPRKMGAPGNPEFAVGAVMHDGTLYLNEEAVSISGATPEYIEQERERQWTEAKRRLEAFRGGRAIAGAEPKIEGRPVVVVDDGVATGATMIAALRWVRSRRPAVLVAASPVAPPSTLEELKGEADHVVCPSAPEPFYAIGEFYERFEQVTDAEVKRVIRDAREGKGGGPRPI